MFDYIRQLVYSDKIFDNPVLGKVSCGAFSETLRNCKDLNFRSKGQDPCLELKQLVKHCYGAKNNEQMNNWILGQFRDSLMLMKFLEQRKSTLPQKIAKNSWAVFTNKYNLTKYEQLCQKK